MADQDRIDAQLTVLFGRLAEGAPEPLDPFGVARLASKSAGPQTLGSADRQRLLVRTLAVAAIIAAVLGVTALAASRHRSPTSPFRLTGALIEPRWGHTATRLLDGRVLVVGGIASAGQTTLASAELYDPSTGRFVRTGSLHSARAWHVAALLTDGRVLVAGGVGRLDIAAPAGNLATTEIYDPVSGTFSDGPALGVPRGPYRWADKDPLRAVVVGLADGSILVAGGGVDLRSLDLVDRSGRTARPGELRMEPAPPDGIGLTSGCSHPRTATLVPDGRVFFTCLGSYHGLGPGGAAWFDPLTGLVSPAHVPLRQSDRSAVLLNEETVLLAGGWSSSTQGAEIYDAQLDAYRSVGATTTSGAVVVALTNGSVLSVGGSGASGTERDPGTTAAEMYRSATRRFLPLAGMMRPRAGHTVTLLGDGRVLIAGGSDDPRAELFDPSVVP